MATLLVLVPGEEYARRVFVNCRFHEIAKNNVFRSAAMPTAKLIDIVKNRHIKTVIDLRTPEHMNEILVEHAALAAMGVTHVNVPSRQVPDKRTVERFFSILDDPSNFPVLIHCWEGLGRAVLFEGLYRIEYEEWTNEQALNASRFIVRGSSFDAGSEKGRFLMNYTRRRVPR